MPTVSTRVLKDQLSQYLRRAEAGECIVVLRDGHPVAALVPAHSVPQREKDEDAILADLAARGLIEVPPSGGRVAFEGPVLPDDGGTPLSRMVLEDRR